MVFSRADVRGVSVHGIFEALGRFVVRRPVAILAFWVALAGVLFLLISPLAVVAQKNPPPLLPEGSQMLASTALMKSAFKEADGGNVAVVVLSNENGLDSADEDVYRRLVEQLGADTTNVKSTQNFVAIPELRKAMTSEDGKAWTLPISLAGTMGTGTGQRAYRSAIKVVEEATAGATLDVNVVGGAATFEDLNKIGARDQLIIEVSTVVTILTILIIVYRNLVAMLMPLITIGISMAVAQQVVAGMGELGLPLGPQTMILMTGMMMGAGVDYAVFLFSRYQECLRNGMSSDDAVVTSIATIGEVITGSAATVAVTFMGLSFASLGVFLTVGPSLAVTIAIAVLGALTILPSLMVLAGRRGWVKVRKDLTGRFWRRSAVHIVRRPKIHLAGSLAVLLALAGCAAFVKYNYDDRQNLPADAESNQGYDALTKHFPVSSTMQQFIMVHAPDVDLRSPKSLADLEQMAQRISQVPGIDLVRGITRPTGEMLQEAKSTYQAGEVGTKLGDASGLIESNNSNLDALTNGAHQMADVHNQIRTQLIGSMGSIREVVSGLIAIKEAMGEDVTFDQLEKEAGIVANMHTVGDSLGGSLEQVTEAYRSSKSMLLVLNNSVACNIDPACVASRAELQRRVEGYNEADIAYLEALSRGLKETKGTDRVDNVIRKVGLNVERALAGLQALGIENEADLDRKLGELRSNVDKLADSSKQLADGVQLLVDQTRNIGGGLDQASSFLLAMKRDASDPAMSGFYIPPQILDQKEFKKAAQLFVSEDGHTVRYLVQTALNPFGVEAMDQVDDIIDAAESARPNTSLANAQISMVGFSAFNNDIRNHYNADLIYIIVMTLVVVFLILALILRAVVAPIYLMLSVVLSFVSAMGLGVLFFQVLLGEDIYWSVAGMAFLVLVAVGADYNLLLISRIRDEAKLGVPSAVIKTVGATGGVITSAGLIFAASMLALTVSSLATVVQMGFVIGVGLLLDTFIVRTITVPAMAVLAGDKNWWPSKTPRQLLEAVRRSAAERKAAEAADAEWFDDHGDEDTGPILQRRDSDDTDDFEEDLDDDNGYATAVRTASTVTLAWGDKDS
ncbi:RND superfamily putative drug exporter [Mycolicibacterium sp. 624]|uniref:MMPL/RND family transporter n=1 Tax=Mycolicibacterium sp. YH-1 TaxID=2908837 RepID=UPI001F4C0BD5|nr:RND family transporter [Mycolicibacterium sp. YH-1]UNB49779.1 RND family transporter [Mycolicibacterium sp. YH-1]